MASVASLYGYGLYGNCRYGKDYELVKPSLWFRLDGSLDGRTCLSSVVPAIAPDISFVPSDIVYRQAALIEDTETLTANYPVQPVEHIFVRLSSDGGTTWTTVVLDAGDAVSDVWTLASGLTLTLDDTGAYAEITVAATGGDFLIRDLVLYAMQLTAPEITGVTNAVTRGDFGAPIEYPIGALLPV